MKMLILDGEKITNMYDVHDIFYKELSFPEFYGRNLDALYDCLTDVSDETVVRLENYEKLEYELGKYAAILVKVLTAASEVNSNLRIEQ